MKTQKAFTLIEVIVVIIIVGILAAAAIPIMRGRVDSAKWSEGKVIMGTIARALRAHVAEKGSDFTAVPTLTQLGTTSGDMDGTYFSGGESGGGNFSWIINNDDPIDFLVIATAPAGVSTPSQITLNHTGQYIESP